MRILVVDDDPILLDLMSEIITRAGQQAITCKDGQQAIEVLGQSLPDLIFTDWEMPNKGGADVIMAAIEYGMSEERIVVFTGSAMVTAQSVSGLTRTTKVRVKYKPFKLEEVRALISTQS